MKIILIAIAITSLGAWALLQVVSQRKSAAQTGNPAANSRSAFACSRLALTAEQRKRHFEELTPALLKLNQGVRELDDGYELQLPSDPATFQLVSEWAIQERLCCPFFDIDLRLDHQGGPLWLRLTGREGVKEFIKAEFRPAWFKQL
ncbi:MAG TPA: hypothetical protein VFB76_09570 [Candidatus Angelobacter sp.]|nr:hypothetical protein [Candidatus Angelobacter sp.]